MNPRVHNLHGKPLPEGAIYVGRRARPWIKDGQVIRPALPESPWHNPYKVYPGDSADNILAAYRADLEWKLPRGKLMGIERLYGRDLACWCTDTSLLAVRRPGYAHICHATILLEIANA